MELDDYVQRHRPPRDASLTEIWAFACSLLGSGHEESWADTFTEDGVMEIPLAAKGFPRRFEGREAIRRQMVPVQRKARQLHPGRRGYLYIHETKDPNVLICEFETTRIEPSTGEEYPMPYVHVVHFRDGEISLLRATTPRCNMAPPSSSEVLAALGRSD